MCTQKLIKFFLIIPLFLFSAEDNNTTASLTKSLQGLSQAVNQNLTHYQLPTYVENGSRIVMPYKIPHFHQVDRESLRNTQVEALCKDQLSMMIFNSLGTVRFIYFNEQDEVQYMYDIDASTCGIAPGSMRFIQINDPEK